MRRKLRDKNIRKLFSRGGSIALTLPKEFLSDLKWRKGQKLWVKKRGQKLVIEDWE